MKLDKILAAATAIWVGLPHESAIGSLNLLKSYRRPEVQHLEMVRRFVVLRV
jgi:hypothetical protein